MSKNSLLDKIAVVEPKKVYINVILLPYIRKIMDALYTGNSLEAVHPMQGLIDSLSTKAQKDLTDITIKLKKYENNIGSFSRKDMKQLFRELMRYLHQTILKGFFARLEKEDFDKLKEGTS